MAWYTGNITYDTLLLAAFGLVFFTIIGMCFVKTPYGRFGTERFGIRLDPRLGWFLMELPATLSFLFFFFRGRNAFDAVPLVFLAVWIVHYANRGFIFPLKMRVDPGHRRTFNLAVVMSGWIVTALHGYLNAVYFTEFGVRYTLHWLADPRFIVGIAVYYAGYLLNIHSDSVIRNLRPRQTEGEPRSGRYSIPRGGAFTYVTSPQYLGEIIAWTGFAVFTWSLAGVFILAITAANLIPRARENHRWYREHFADYPASRRALVPFLW
ncbi:MAG: 3-oxo-5-alpha-steroid 4-dehydrogenase [Spirochaetes bacterium]|nr:3-oxo-5-alpha-steroid 4-dehydrogenase [Spirochaetota bacterium]